MSLNKPFAESVKCDVTHDGWWILPWMCDSSIICRTYTAVYAVNMTQTIKSNQKITHCSGLSNFYSCNKKTFLTWLLDSIKCFIVKINNMRYLRYIWGRSCKGTALFWKRGRGAAAHLHLKRHVWKPCVSASTQNRHFQNDIINDLWGILSWSFTETFWGHLRLILHIVKRDIIGAL